MASIQAGTYSVREILDRANFDFEKEAAADYNNGAPDFRRVKVGGLGFNSLDERVRIPVTAEAVAVTLDEKEVTSLSVKLDEGQQEERERSLAVARAAAGEEPASDSAASSEANESASS